jgi:hypothetical protein
MTRVSEYFDLGLAQPQLDFVDVAIETDTKVYLDPRGLLLLNTDWGRECVALVQDFFGCVLAAIKDGNTSRAIKLLNQLHEPNETRLGLSKGRSQGHALGPELAGRVREALTRSEAVKTGLLTDLEDTILMIEGIRNDLISDITTNVIRQPLVRYTQHACEDLGIPMEEAIYPGGPFWDPGTEQWYQDFVTLPVANKKPLLLVPKVIVRKKMDYDPDEYYDNYIIPLLREEEIEAGSSLVTTIKKTGEPRVTKKDLIAKYGKGKAVNEAMTRAHPQLLESYRKNKNRRVHPPISHGDIAELTGTEPPDFDALLAAVVAVKPGKAGATAYHRAVEALLTPLFYPWLTMPEREVKINAGRKRIDITFVNAASVSFFDWLARRYDAAYVMVECKNYAGDPANPELDQLAGRFSPRRGNFGLLVCRSIADKDLFAARCRDTANDGQGYIVALDDDDLRTLVEARKADDGPGALRLLRKRFNALVM